MVKTLNAQLKKIAYSKNIMFFMSLLSALSVGTVVCLGDSDFIWQTHLGQVIVTEHRFDGMSDLVWGTQGLGWYLDHEWLTNVLFYILFRVFGLVGSVVVYKLIIVALLTISIYFLVKEFMLIDNMSWFTYLTLVVLSYNFSMLLLKPKAYELSALLFIWLIIILERYKKGLLSFKYLAGIIFMMTIVWNNCHSGSVVLLFGVLGLYWLLCFRNKSLFIVGIIAGLLLLINPYGYMLPYFDILHFSDSTMKALITEWQSLTLTDAAGKAIFLFIGISFLYLLHIKRDKENLVYFLLYFIFLFFTFSSKRHYLYLYPIIILIVCLGQFEDLKKWNVKSFFVPTLGVLVLAFYIEIIAWLGIPDFCDKYVHKCITPELEHCLADTIGTNNDGFYDGYINVWTLGYKSFRSGMFPYTRERNIDSVHMEKGGINTIEEIISKYGLNKFLCEKYTELEDGFRLTRPLYDYLYNSSQYVMLYDDDKLAYFVDKECYTCD